MTRRKPFFTGCVKILSLKIFDTAGQRRAERAYHVGHTARTYGTAGPQQMDSPTRLSSSSSSSSLPPKYTTERKKAELQDASSIVLNTPPLIWHSLGWRACCLTLCKSAYVRNNRKGGLKNLRCFPHCLTGGHSPRGFCGSSIYARVWLPPNYNISSQQYVLFIISFVYTCICRCIRFHDVVLRARTGLF